MEFSELLTVPGAALGAGLLTSVMKQLWLPGKWARQFSLLTAMTLLAVATAIDGGANATEWFATIVLAGPTAGLAAIAAYDQAIKR